MSQVIIDVEYLKSGRIFEFTRKRGQIYVGVEPRKSDGITCLIIRAPGASRNHNIEVGNVYAITRDHVRHVLETPNDRWRLRAQEISRLIEGRFSEDWAPEYFDPQSPKYFKNESGYEPEIEPELEAKFASKPLPARDAPPKGHGGFEAIGMAIFLIFFLGWLL